MKGPHHAPLRRASRAAVAAAVSVATLPNASVTQAGPPGSLPPCAEYRPAGETRASLASPWQALLDGDGTVVGHRLVLRQDGVETSIETGRRGFAATVGGDRILVGERQSDGTDVTMIDTTRGCHLWQRWVDGLVYDVKADGAGLGLRLALHEPATRRYEGDLLVDLETGSSNAMIDGECSDACVPNDGSVDPAAFGPVAVSRPVPAFPAGGWDPGRTLSYRWRPGDVPPKWARAPLRRAAEDAATTSRSRSPAFILTSGATDTVRYTPAFPTFCTYGIACASRSMPSWTVWIRPHGTDFSWGTLRWCQRLDRAGCFDLRRVMLHELGHVTGLDHPSTAGFRLAAHETVMHAITPARPSPSSSRHAFGRCDVATLQELYDVPGRKERISTCNGVSTRLTLRASESSIVPGESVRLVAELRVADRAEFGLLRNNRLDGRSVQLKYRHSGSDGAWSTLWMKPLDTPGRYAATMWPQASWEFKAVFPSPTDEGLRYSRSGIRKVTVDR